MAQRFVRVQAVSGEILYGALEANRQVEVWERAPWLGGKASSRRLAETEYHLLPPCLPSKIIAVGRNYSAHAAELGNEVPPEPLLFLKPPSALAAPQQIIPYPAQSRRVDYEGELALIIGAETKNCSEEQATSRIWGYTIANDITARDLQRQDSQWTRAKGFDGFCPLGPWAARQISLDARLETWINDEPAPRQSAQLNEMIFKPAVLVSYISHIMTLWPGDAILTGTPAGIGELRPGDRVRVKIEGIGELENSLGELKR
ncbi:MAG: 5-oxo-1,2,5-tricarboxylic-3-penten acid decarboxylase [Cyanobacteria bacterium RI_101]|nr:5-oxo-1,2,5-tricarboxylic-3-penten acid decarboxylase [Cyanobacteria bacterium RI_101]